MICFHCGKKRSRKALADDYEHEQEEVQVSFPLRNLSSSRINKAKKTETNFFLLIEVEVETKLITTFRDIKVFRFSAFSLC